MQYWCLALALLAGAGGALCLRKHLKDGEWWGLPGAGIGGIISIVCFLIFLIIGKGFLLTLIRICIILGSGAGMIFGWKQFRFNNAKWGKPVTIVCFCISMLFAFIHFRSQSGPSQRSIVNRELAFRGVASRKLAQHLNEQYKGARVILVCRPNALNSTSMAAKSYATLKSELERGMTIVGELVAKPTLTKELTEQAQGYIQMGSELGISVEAMTPDELATALPYELWWNAAAFDKLLENMPSCDLIVCTIMPPDDMDAMAIWTKDDRPKFAFALGASSPTLIPKIQSGDIVAMVQYKEDLNLAASMASPPNDVDEAFAIRYVLVTPDNADAGE